LIKCWKQQLRQYATTLGASGGRRQPKRLNVNANNRSERAEQGKYQSEIRCKNPKTFPNWLNPEKPIAESGGKILNLL